jgi:hypothetical protein
MSQRKASVTYILIALSAFIAYSANAKCIFTDPLKQADVIVYTCEGVTFSSSNSQISLFGEKSFPAYMEGASYSGTLITASVKKSWFIWEENEKHITKDLDVWPAEKSLLLFVDGDSNVVCPKQLSETIRIQTTRRCCDVLPARGRCLIPGAIEIVTVVSE